MSRSTFYLLTLFLVSVQWIVSPATSDTFHIVSSPAAPCPGEFIGEPCLTLQQYVSNPSISNDNITLLFQTGNHTMSSTFSTSNAMKLTMSGSNVLIQCSSSAAQLTLTSIQYVYISGLCLTGCGAISFSSLEQLDIENCTFQYITGNSAALTLSSVTSANITQCNFLNNRNTQTAGQGGALYIYRSEVQISNNRFYGNYVSTFGHGGAIYTVQYSSMTVRDSIFESNSAYGYGYGGAIYIGHTGMFTFINTLFLANTVGRFSYHGGAIYNSRAILLLSKCNFTSNSAGRSNSVTYGGAIYTSGPHLEINDSTFTGNNVIGYGGGIFSNSIINVVRNTNFTKNTATGNGGAVYTSTLVNFYQCLFLCNSAGEHGGGIYVSTNSRGYINITSSLFLSNFVHNYGGGMYAAGLNLSVYITSSSFINNTALTLGGGAIYSNSRYSNVTLASSTFSHNSASYCSVLDVDEYYHFNVNLTDSIFTHNTATGQLIGGGVACIRNASINVGGGVACIRNASINIIRSTFKHNYADLHGGVFYIDESATSVDGSLFVNNSAAVDGGVFYTYVHASNYNIRRSQFSLNSAGDDGGVLFIGRVNSRVNIDESIFSLNDASDRGGVVAIIASSMYMEINRTNIFNNTASFGGIISACNSEVTVLEEDLFVTTDPICSFCTLYDGDVTHFNITAPRDLDDVIPSTTILKLPPSSIIVNENGHSPTASQAILVSTVSSLDFSSSVYRTAFNEIITTSASVSTHMATASESVSTHVTTASASVSSHVTTASAPVSTHVTTTSASVSTHVTTESWTSTIVTPTKITSRPSVSTYTGSSSDGLVTHIEPTVVQTLTSNTRSMIESVSISLQSSTATYISPSSDVNVGIDSSREIQITLIELQISTTVLTTSSKHASGMSSTTPEQSPTLMLSTISDMMEHDTRTDRSESEDHPIDSKELATTVYVVPYLKINSLQVNINTAMACFFFLMMIVFLIVAAIWIIQKMLHGHKKVLTFSKLQKCSKTVYEIQNFDKKKCDGNIVDTEEFKEKEDFD